MRARMGQYAGHASWAVWGQALPSEDQFVGPERKLHRHLRLPDDAETDRLLHDRAVLVGLNPGNAASQLHMLLGDWYAFHCGQDQIPAGYRYSNDHLIAEACRGTGLWGAFMTDLFPTLAQSASGKVADQVRDDPAWARRSVSAFVREVEQLGAEDPPVLVCFGAQVANYARAYLPPYLIDRVVGVTHYSASAAGKHRHDARRYRELVHRQLAGHSISQKLL